MENINKKMRPQIIELEIGETVSFPIEKMKSVRAQTSEISCIMESIYSTSLNRVDRTITVIRKK